MRLDPNRVHLYTHLKNYRTSKYEKLDKLNKLRYYPNPRTYRGPFEAKRNENFVRPHVHFEMLSTQIKAVQDSQVTSPSPVHMVWRHQNIEGGHWWETNILRKLGLHTEQNYQRVLVPNTPHHNKLLWQVKHMVRVKPLTFPDGFPTEKDIGCVDINECTGEVRIHPKFKIPQERIDADKKPSIMEQQNMRHFLRKLIGIFQNYY